MRAQVDEECLLQASSHFWEQMVSMKLDPIPVSAFQASDGHLLGSVELSGAWRGRVEVRMASELAWQATGAMMMQAVETVVEADVLDATREIANMIAGSIKSSLPRPCAMTVPTAAFEPDPFHCQELAEDALAVALRHADGDILVRIREGQSRQ